MLTIRLRRVGARRDPHYRVVVADRAAGRDGPFLEIVGHYHPRQQPAEVVFDVDRTESWLARGAQMSDTVRSLYRAVQAGANGDAPSTKEVKAKAPAEVSEAAAEAEADEGAADEADAVEEADRAAVVDQDEA